MQQTIALGPKASISNFSNLARALGKPRWSSREHWAVNLDLGLSMVRPRTQYSTGARVVRENNRKQNNYVYRIR